MKDNTKKEPQVSAFRSLSEQDRTRIRQMALNKRKKRKKIRNTVLLCLLILIIIGAGGGAVWLIQEKRASSSAREFQISREFSDIASKTAARSAGFAADLCVAEGGDIALGEVTLEEGQTGALMDLTAKKVLYAKGIYERIYPASITKIMTALVAIQYGNLTDTVTITQEDVTLEEGSQVCGFLAGDQLTMDQLLHCLLVFSGNDAAAAIASHVGGTQEHFVELMNEYARKLGMTGTHFGNPHGLHQDNHYTTVYDIYLMLQEAYKHTEFIDITSLSSYTVVFPRADGTEASIYLEATDYYLNGLATPPRNVTILAGKTGTTDQAGSCLALITQNAYGNPFISIVLGAYDKTLLYEEMGSLLEKINEL
ncbi:MAG: serine hydrolase [Eubacteriales bacterium]|nr:serine hydrolase [Eubacteriales bacterium]